LSVICPKCDRMEGELVRMTPYEIAAVISRKDDDNDWFTLKVRFRCPRCGHTVGYDNIFTDGDLDYMTEEDDE